MGLIQAFKGAIGGTFADQWKDFIAPTVALTDHVMLAVGLRQGTNVGRGSNIHASANIISNGSLILVPEGTALLLVENGAITGLVTEAGGYQFQSNNVNSKTVFADGFFSSLVQQSWDRFKFGGIPGAAQFAFYVNLKEITGLRYGTQNPIRYKDANYNNVMLSVTSFGTYSIRVIDPIALFKNLTPIDIASGASNRLFTLDEGSVSETLFSGFVGSLAAALSSFTKGGKSIDDIQGGTVEFAKEVNIAVEESYKWASSYGLCIAAVQPRGIDWDESSAEVVSKYNLGAMMQGGVGNAYAQTQIAEGFNAAGNSEGGAASIMGMGLGLGAVGGVGGLMQQPTSPAVASLQPEQPTQATASDDPVTSLAKLKGLLEQGLITQEQFDAKQQEILSRL